MTGFSFFLRRILPVILVLAALGTVWGVMSPGGDRTEILPPPPVAAPDAGKEPAPRDIPFLDSGPAFKIPDHLADVTAPPRTPAAMPPRARIVVIIDDMGENRVQTRQATTLPGPLTLSYLPHPPHIGEEVEEGRAAGHEIMMHMPMEPLNAALAKPDYFLRAGMEDDEFLRVLDRNLDSFKGYAGINNHMGSRLTQDRHAMRLVMGRLKARGLLFVDSRTINTSVAADEARQAGVPYAVRNIFLDDKVTPEAIRRQLGKVERTARARGLAIAIGHPKAETIQALRDWLPTLKSKGFSLVPASEAVLLPPA